MELSTRARPMIGQDLGKFALLETKVSRTRESGRSQDTARTAWPWSLVVMSMGAARATVAN